MEQMDMFMHTLLNRDITRGGEEEYMKLKTYEEKIKYMLNLCDEYKLINMIKVLRVNVKSVEVSRQHRMNGNKLFQSAGDPTSNAEANVKIWHKIYILYSTCIGFAPGDSEELALGYGNRSVVLFKIRRYSDCLSDVERALKLKYPDKLRAKLLARKAQCLVILDSPKSEIEETLNETKKWLSKMDENDVSRKFVENVVNNPINKKSFPKPYGHKRLEAERNLPAIPKDNPEIKGATSAIEIQYSNKHKQHLVATRDIEPGELLAVQMCYSSFVAPDRCYEFCSHCLKQIWSTIPCDKCVSTSYCSESCREEALSQYHDIECQYIKFFASSEKKNNQLSGLRDIIKAVRQAGGVEELKKMVDNIEAHRDLRTRGFTGNRYDGERYESYYSAPTLAEKREFNRMFNDAVSAAFTVFILATKSNFFDKKFKPDFNELKNDKLVVFIGGLIMRHQQLVTMSHFILFKEEDGEASPLFTTSIPLRSLIAHSCNANTERFHYGRHVVMYATAPIKKGDLLLDDYLCHFATMSKHVRQLRLKTIFRFDCKCEACEGDWPTISPASSYKLRIMPQSTKASLDSAFFQFMIISSFREINEDPCHNVFNEIIRIFKIFNEKVCHPCSELYFITDVMKYWFQMRGTAIDEIIN